MKINLGKWTLTNKQVDLKTGKVVGDSLNNIKVLLEDVNVPGDITNELRKANIIADPFFGLNHENLKEYLLEDYYYVSNFDVAKNDIDNKNSILLTFKGIDVFSDIYLNGELLGSTENMFLEYQYDILDKVKVGLNTLVVKMNSTVKKMNEIDASKYFGVFNTERVLVRKEQCCFGWDWAPKIMGYGIWKDVTLEVVSKERIVDCRYKTCLDGETTFFVELNYYKRSYFDPDGNFIEVKETYNDTLKVSINNNGKWLEKEIKVEGNNLFVTLQNKDAKLWWPVGYGASPLYDYKVELIRDNKVISSYNGRLAYRTVELSEKAVTNNALGYKFIINGKEIFIKGSNWVPVDCFTGCITKERYESLILKAKQANLNMLRVWGGGIYEDDAFFDICDEQGMLVWQDFVLACGDIPDDNALWLENILKECEYQIKRLRNHPSLIYWCGGNEKTGTFGIKVKYGDNFVDVTLRGLVDFLDGTRPYGRQSPCSHTDIGNDPTSGESHRNSFEPSINAGIENYRKTVSTTLVPFVSECAIMGPTTRQTFEKIFPADKLWPMNEYWSDRLMCNPYATIKMDFCDEQKMFAERMYGKTNNLDEFISRAMLVHAETLKCEIDYQRAHKGITSGFLNWMFSEIWPSGTWSIVDYYGEAKQAYYAMQNSFKSVYMSFYYDADGNTYLFGVNDTLNNIKVKYTVSCKTFDGKVLWSKKGHTELNTLTAYKQVVDTCPDNAYLVVNYTYGKVCDKTLYSPTMWRNMNFNNNVTYEVLKNTDDETIIGLKTNAFAKSVKLELPENCSYTFSENYLDLEQGDEVIVYITGKKVNINDLKIRYYE